MGDPEGRFPGELKPVYEYLQSELDEILSDPASRVIITSLDLSKHKGNTWIDLRDALKPRVSKWTINNKTWYSYIVFENIRRVLKSQQEAHDAWCLLVKHGMNPDGAYWDEAHAAGLYPTTGFVRNLIRSNTEPALPYHAILNLDYTVSEKQMFLASSDGLCEMKIGPDSMDWLKYQILVPASVDPLWTGRVAKPCFTHTRKDDWMARLSLEVKPREAPVTDDGILGIDLGMVKPYAATAVYPDGSVSQEQLCSKRLQHLNRKDYRLVREKTRLEAKNDRCRVLNQGHTTWHMKPGMDASYAGVKHKIPRVKHERAVLQSVELAETATRLHCREAHVENLAWLDSRGGKWDHSAEQSEISDRMARAGVKCSKVNAAYSSSENPITGERGVEDGRGIVFEDGTRVDRDRLASIGLACRVPGGKRGKGKPRVPATLPKDHATPRRSHGDHRKREYYAQIVKNIKDSSKTNSTERTDVVVTARPCVPGDDGKFSGAWTLANRVSSAACDSLRVADG